jgi:hypothetical protein
MSDGGVLEMHAQVVALFVGLALISGFAALFMRLRTHRGTAPASPEFVARFSVARYRPMQRLLAEEDYEFLAAQPGYDRAIARRLRQRRRSVFRKYLRGMARDFDRLYAAAKQIAVYSERDRKDLLVLLVRQKVAFECGLALIHMRLALHAIGMAPVDVRGLIDALEEMSQHARPFVPAASAA